MTDDPDDEFLAALRRIPRYRLSDEAKERHLRALAELAAQPGPAPRRFPWLRFHPRRIWVIVAVAVGALGAGVGTAAALGVFESPTDRTIAHCYATADLHEPNNHMNFAVAAPSGGNPSLHDAANSALEICTGAWQQGRLSTTPPYVTRPSPDATPGHPVPTLIACVLPSGQVGIFPGSEQTCLELDLHPARL